jgi:hypothetical protein
VSRRLAATFLERTGGAVSRADAMPRLATWADVAVRLHGTGGWRGEFLAQAFLEAAPAALFDLSPADYGRWADIAVACTPTVKERDFFAALPRSIARWPADERARFLDAVLRIAGASPVAAHTVYRALPPALDDVPSELRAGLLRVLARLHPAPAGAAELAPVAGAILLAVPDAERLTALDLVDGVAKQAPAAAVAALRVLPQVYEEASPPAVRRWFATGLTVAAESAAAGEAYFALVSRTSVKVLHAGSTAATLEETQGVWRKLVQMVSGAPVTVRSVDAFALRPPLESAPAEGTVSLPARVDCLQTHEENCRIYRLLALHLAGRRLFGTYEWPGDGLAARVRACGSGSVLEEMFLLAEGVRVHHRLCAAFDGVAGDARWVGSRVLAVLARDPSPSREVVVDALFAALLADQAPAGRPWDALAAVSRLVAPLAAPDATVEDSMRVAQALAAAVEVPVSRQLEAEPDLLLLDDLAGLEPLEPGGEDGLPTTGESPRAPGVGKLEGEGLELTLAPPSADLPAGSRALTLEEIRRLIEAGARIEQATGDGSDGPGLDVTDLLGKLPPEQREALRRLAEAPVTGTRRPSRHATECASDVPAFVYDEWDHRIGDYRSRWCRLHEVSVEGDSGEFFGTTLADYARVVPEVRRQFQRIRPETYRNVRGLEDGEDFDLNAVIDARVEARARRAPSTKLYRARVREVRDVATLFLLDMSASTDEPVGPPAGGRPARRIIDVTKEALVIMAEALEELGDAYAIYGFSGQGRDNVEFYLVKAFGEALGPTVKGRIGGIVPKRSTRMGTALRHAVEKMSGVPARVKHLILLSDGFPQDHDYGEDRRNHTYGIRDTAVALREADAAGITPFCITVDRAGHDYLRQMCDASRYVVLDDVSALPRELPRIYQRVVRT